MRWFSRKDIYRACKVWVVCTLILMVDLIDAGGKARCILLGTI
jgi:hypothetical protein